MLKIISLSLRNKLLLGFGFLFSMIMFLWITGTYFIFDLSRRSEAMLSENYQTVESARHLIESLENLNNGYTALILGTDKEEARRQIDHSAEIFSKNLEAAEQNITEPGEGDLIIKIAGSYSDYIDIYSVNSTMNTDPEEIYHEILLTEYVELRDLIMSLWDMNMDAITHKNMKLESTASRAFLIISLIGTICFLVSILFLWRYPSNIARPLKELIRGIREIAHRNYDQRLDFNTNDEFGQLAEAFNSMASRLDEFEHSNLSMLLYEKRRIETIINNMNDAIIGLNEKNEIIFSNNNACRLCDLDESSLIGKSANDLAGKNSILQILLGDLSEIPGYSHDFKPVRLVKSGKVEYYTREILKVEITKTGESNAEKAGMVIILKNVTRYLEQDEAKTNFIATISHELKSPISALRLNLKLLGDPRIGELNGEQSEILNALQTESDKMLAITSELLDLAQLETGNFRFSRIRITPDELISFLQNSAESLTRDNRAVIHYNVYQGLSPVYADPEKTIWVLINLITNAIYYSESEVDIYVEASMRNREEVLFKIRDTGKGIEGKYLKMIFERFFRVPGSEVKGTGLGLAIAREIIVKQNGKIWAESTMGSGSTFCFTLPVFKEGEKK